MKSIIVLFDDGRQSLFPLTFTRAQADIRVGILTIKEKWQRLFPEGQVSCSTQSYLQAKYAVNLQEVDEKLFINASVLPSFAFVDAVSGLTADQVLKKGAKVLATRSNEKTLQNVLSATKKLEVREFRDEIRLIERSWDVFAHNDEALLFDYDLLTRGKTSSEISRTNLVLGDQVFVEPGVQMEGVSLNSTTGPIYIGQNANIMEGSCLRGPLSIGENAVIKMQAKIYGGTTIGPYCKVGGEISNSVLFGYSNKAHDGYLGNSVIGEWCNLGADTNNSNLKNNYGLVKAWDMKDGKSISTGLQFCGLIMGDHSKTAINTAFNTGSVVGMSSNVFNHPFSRKFVPNFFWSEQEKYKLEKALETAERVMARRGLKFSAVDKSIFEYVYSKFMD